MIYALAACATWFAGCSKEPAGMEMSSLDGGKHVLTELSASLEGDADETRTSLQTSNNNVVYWTTKDRILLVNTTTYDSWYYELTTGAGTSIGRFEPVGDAATCEEDMSNIVAVYPAIAAVVDKPNKTLSFTINENWNATDEGKKKLSDCGIRSWNNDSPTAFTHNDIKVSYHANGTANGANFKFRQLGTWCALAFDFTADTDVRKESLQSVEITTTTGDVQISGTQQVDLSDPNTPALAAKTSELTDADKTVKWTFNSPAGMTTAFTKSLMLFPGLENKQLKITAETNMRTLVFYAKPTTKFTAGTVLRFPIGFKQNFNTEIQPTDDPTTYALAYTNTEKELYPFYYYGDANCHLITGSNTQCTIDVTPHKASPYYEKNDAEATAAKQATCAKVIWYETAMGEPSINNSGNSAAITGNSFTVTLADATQYGNALVGIYENETSDTPLWSYHIWHPKIEDMEAALLTYPITNSGTYKVMPLALGANKPAVLGDTGTNGEYAGFYYQWGRKDPLGRIAKLGNGTFVAVNGESAANFFQTSDQVRELKDILLAPAAESKEPYWDETTQDYVLEANGKSIDRYMIEYAIAHPTQWIVCSSSINTVMWTVIPNVCLLGNPEGYNYPRMAQTYKSVFDPCPKGYRVAPADIWINFSKLNDETNEQTLPNAMGGFNRGYAFYYNESMDTDVYPTCGYRYGQRATNPGPGATAFSAGYYISSAPSSFTGSSMWRLRIDQTTTRPTGAYGDTINGFNIRCVKEPNE